MPLPLPGNSIEIAYADQRATVVEVGGGLRTYEVAGAPILDGYGADEMVTAARGQPLIPWPNRLHGGRYTWDEQTHEVPLDEPGPGNALHGLCRFRGWEAAGHGASEVTMRLRLHASPAYPFALDLAVRYCLGPGGLTVQTSATNRGATAAPYAQGAHPYLTVGEPLDRVLLTVPADTWLPTDGNQIPTGREPVAGSAQDFRTPRLIGDQRIDHAFTDLRRDPDGRARLVLEGVDRAVELWVGEGYRYLEVFTGDTVPDVDRRRQGLGVEPMTAPPNAFVTGEDLLRLEPEQSVERTWGIAAR